MACPNEAEAATALAEFVAERGGQLKTPQVNEFYNQYPKHKVAIKQSTKKVSDFCAKFPKLLAFKGDAHSGFIIADESIIVRKKLKSMLESRLCEANGRLHGSVMGQLYKLEPSFRSYVAAAGGLPGLCYKLGGMHVDSANPAMLVLDKKASKVLAGKNTTRKATNKAANKGPCNDSESDDGFPDEVKPTRLSVLDIRWAHSNIRIKFKNGMLLVDTLRQLLRGEISPSKLPEFQTIRSAGHWYAVTGNRRLWVLREYQKILATPLRISVKALRPDQLKQSWVQKRMNTTSNGISIEYKLKLRDRVAFPSMAFALAAGEFLHAIPGEVMVGTCMPEEVDRALAHAILDQGGSSSLARLASKVKWSTDFADKHGKFEQYLRARPHLFNIHERQAGLVQAQDCLIRLWPQLPPPPPPLEGSTSGHLQPTTSMCRVVKNSIELDQDHTSDPSQPIHAQDVPHHTSKKVKDTDGHRCDGFKQAVHSCLRNVYAKTFSIAFEKDDSAVLKLPDVKKVPSERFHVGVHNHTRLILTRLYSYAFAALVLDERHPILQEVWVHNAQGVCLQGSIRARTFAWQAPVLKKMDESMSSADVDCTQHSDLGLPSLISCTLKEDVALIDSALDGVCDRRHRSTLTAAKHWLAYTRSHPEVKGAARAIMKEAFEGLLETAGIFGPPKPNFSCVMAYLRSIGHQELASWSDSTNPDSKPASSLDDSLKARTQNNNEISNSSTCSRQPFDSNPRLGPPPTSSRQAGQSSFRSASIIAEVINVESKAERLESSIIQFADMWGNHVKLHPDLVGAERETMKAAFDSLVRAQSGSEDAAPPFDVVMKHLRKSQSTREIGCWSDHSSRDRKTSVEGTSEKQNNQTTAKDDDPWLHSSLDPWQQSGRNTHAPDSQNSKSSMSVVNKTITLPGPVPRPEVDLLELFPVLPEECKSRLLPSHENTTRTDKYLLKRLILDLGMRPQAVYGKMRVCLSDNPLLVVTKDMLAKAQARLFLGSGIANRVQAGRSLHRVSTLHDESGSICGLTIHICSAIIGACTVVQDILDDSSASMLILGSPRSGKSTMLRDIARSLSQHLDVMLVDSDRALGASATQHCLGFTRRVGIRTIDEQLSAVEDAIERHSPDILILDHVLPHHLAAAARTCQRFRVRLIAVVQNTLHDAASQLPSELSAFDAILELSAHNLDSCRVILQVKDAAESIRTGKPFVAQIRNRTWETGGITVQHVNCTSSMIFQ